LNLSCFVIKNLVFLTYHNISNFCEKKMPTDIDSLESMSVGMFFAGDFLSD